ncbi:MAG TPA: hypothetical protein VMT53_20180, partial [Terriglobales bacterium]|nr:hypothetical protein [Terriglobales bacterium]
PPVASAPAPISGVPASQPTALPTAPPLRTAAQSPTSQPQATASKVVTTPAAKPAKPKEVYYNIVGEPINPTEDE